MAINFLGTWEEKENKTGNTGTKAYFREQGTPKIEEILLENTRKVLEGRGRSFLKLCCRSATCAERSNSIVGVTWSFKKNVSKIFSQISWVLSSQIDIKMYSCGLTRSQNYHS